MAAYFGIARLNLERRPDGLILKEARIFPETPTIAQADWNKIVQFYSSKAPEQLPATRPLTNQASLFSPRIFFRSPDAPCTTLLQIEQGSICVGDAQTRTLKKVGFDGKLQTEWPTDSGPVALSKIGGDLVVTLVGRILPSDELTGQVWSFPWEGASEPMRILRGLRRPTHTAVADLNQDGSNDLVVCSFGNQLGRLSWFPSMGERRSEERILSELPGSVRSLPYDWNGDGRVDLTVLRAQGREGADLYINKGKGQFSMVTLWNDPPAWGNAFIELVDLDRDGRPEILAANGDNGDFPCAPKPYHGIRIFSVSSQLKAELRFRFTTPGAYGAKAADFDLDGDIDLAGISFFPDFENAPEQSFFYLRNDGNWNFTPQIVPGLTQGRWLVVESGDVDRDGDPDLLLGSFVRGPLTIPIPNALKERWEKEKIAIVLLENKTVHDRK
jgi:hypothetical protein